MRPWLINACLFMSLVYTPHVSASPTWQLDLYSDPGDYVGQGLEYHFTQADCCFLNPNLFDSTHDGVVDYVQLFFHAPVYTPFWDLDIGTNWMGTNLMPGVYDDAQAYGETDPYPTLSFFLDGRGASTVVGSFILWDIAFDYEHLGVGAAGLQPTLLRLNVSFEQHSEGEEPGLFGYFSYDAGYAAVPEPTSLFLLTTGLLGLLIIRGRLHKECG
ncbi:PEP-CTERM sorting domain-containing protein [Nitrospira sp. Nam74]